MKYTAPLHGSLIYKENSAPSKNKQANKQTNKNPEHSLFHPPTPWAVLGLSLYILLYTFFLNSLIQNAFKSGKEGGG